MTKVFGSLTNKIVLPEKDTLQALAAGKAEGSRQFRLLNFSPSEDGATLVDPHASAAALTAPEQSDVVMRVDLVGFHAGINIEPEQKATLRVDIGKDPLSSSSIRPLFWSVAAGLDLAGAIGGGKDSRAAPRRLRTNFEPAFSGRNIEVAGGLAELRFEVVAHKEAPWWRRFFKFASSTAGSKLAAAIGFPGIAEEAIHVINEAFGQLHEEHTPLFKSNPMTLALTQEARDDFSAGNSNVKVGVLNPGFSILVTEDSYSKLHGQELYYLGTHGVVLPRELTVDDFIAGAADPFQDVTYAVIRVKSTTTTLQPTL